MADAKSLNNRLSKLDKEKLDEYFSSIRDVEQKIQQRKKWSKVPFPKPSKTKPETTNLLDDISVMFELAVLSFKLDLQKLTVYSCYLYTSLRY